MELVASETFACVLEELKRIPCTEAGRPVHFAQSGKKVILTETQTGTGAFLAKYPAGGVLVLCATSGLAATEALRQLVLERSLDARHIALFGTRSWTSEEHDFVQRQRIQVYSMLEISREGLGEMTDAVMMYVRQWQAFHVVLHMDVVDPAFVPGLAASSPGGLSARELLYVVQRLALIQTLASVELLLQGTAELQTCRLAARILAELGACVESRG